MKNSASVKERDGAIRLFTITCKVCKEHIAVTDRIRDSVGATSVALAVSMSSVHSLPFASPTTRRGSVVRFNAGGTSGIDALRLRR